MDVERLEELKEISNQIMHNFEEGQTVWFNLDDNDYHDLAYSLRDLIDAEVERQSVTDDDIYETIAHQSVKSEEVQEVIDTLQVIRPSEKEIQSGEYPDVAEAIDMAITALRDYLEAYCDPDAAQIEIEKEFL